MTTLLIPASAFEREAYEVRGRQYRHLFRALRLQVGDRVRVVDGGGRARWSEILAVRRESGTLKILAEAPSNESDRHLELLVAPLRPERASWLVEKATEIGVRAIRWLHTERSGRRYGGATLQRLQRVAEAAVEQCGRAVVPDVTSESTWDEALTACPGDQTFVLDPAAGDDWRLPPWQGRRFLFVGPEGGFSPQECEALVARGANALGLGDRVLRVETAAIAGTALMLLRRNV